MGNGIWAEPFANLYALAHAEHGYLLHGIWRQLLVSEIAEYFPVEGAIRTGRVPSEVAGEEETRERFGQQHLTTSKHASPALVRVGSGAVYVIESTTVREPNATRNVVDEVFLD